MKAVNPKYLLVQLPPAPITLKEYVPSDWFEQPMMRKKKNDGSFCVIW